MASLWRARVDRVLGEGEELLDLRGDFLGDDGAQEVAQRLQGSPNLVKELWLFNNNIGDAGAGAVAELLRSDPPALEKVSLNFNKISPGGIAALADALRENTALKELLLYGNAGVVRTDAEASAGIAALVAAIGVNVTLEKVDVSPLQGPKPHQATIDAALADTGGRCAGRERFLAGPTTKSARKND
jgi:Leucine Rich repeat